MSDSLHIQMRTHELFELNADRFAPNDAVVCNGQRMSYAQLNTRANRIAHHLISLGVKHEEPVGVAFEKSCDLIVAILGILKSGAAYVPLGENLPVSRLRSILQDSGCTRAVVQNGHLDDLWTDSVELISLDDAMGCAETNPGIGGSPDDLMYILYTSGSTGEPKGVRIEHAGVVRLVQGQDYLPFGPELTYLFLGPISFDLSTLGIFGPLLSGAKMVIDPSLIPDADELDQLIREEDVKASLFIFGLFNTLFEARPEVFETMTDILVGGEAVWTSIMRRAMERLPHIRFVNVYGPTEATVLSTAFPIREMPSEELSTVPIGVPLRGMTHVVVDTDLRAVSRGELGELCMAGIGIARDYLDSPELTSEKFPDVRFPDGHTQRVYRTGDRVYELDDGSIVFDGRIDEQVKIRGFRIELGALEAAAERMDSVVRSAAVVNGIGDDAKLILWIVGDPGDGLEAMRAYLGDALPEYMVPDEIRVVDNLPITENGKIDKRSIIELINNERRDLPRAEYLAPTNQIEEKLCAIWEDVLGVEHIGIGDSFLDLGGHSLRAVIVCSRIRDLIGIAIHASSVIRCGSIRELSLLIDQQFVDLQDAPGKIPLTRADRSGPLPMSLNQERLWMHDQIHPNDPSYNITFRMDFHGDLDELALRDAWNALHDRHEVLRTRLDGIGQTVLDITDITPDLVWAENADEGEIARLQRVANEHRFDLASVPLARLIAIRVDADHSILVVCMHHVISDAWSCDVLRKELGALYESRINQKPSGLPELEVQYAEFTQWQRRYIDSNTYQSDRSFWTDKLMDAPVVDLPTDYPRDHHALNSDGDRVRESLGPDLVRRVRSFSRRSNATPNTILLAAFQAWVHRLTGSEDVVLGMPIANREQSEFENLIGFFMETIALRVGVRCDDTFETLLERSSGEFWESHDHQNVPFQHVVHALHGGATFGRNPLFEIFFNYIPIRVHGGDGSLFTFGTGSIENQTAKFDLTSYIYDDGDSISIEFNYRTGLFSRETVRRYLMQYITLLGSALDDPSARISGLVVLSGDESEAWETRRVGPDVPLCDGETLVGRLMRRATKSPDSIAIRSEHGRLTYRELAEWGVGAEKQLIRCGAQRGDRVMLGLRDPREMGAAILGALRSGVIYVPVDLAWPESRIELIAEQCAPIAIIMDADIGDALSIDTVTPGDWASSDGALPLTVPDPDAPAYMLFTSGSTGVPKGVVQTQSGVLAHNTVFAESLGIGPTDRVLMTSSHAFDAAPMDMYAAWFCGASWCPYTLQTGSPEGVGAFIETHQITVFHAAPAVLRWFANVQDADASFSSIRVVVMGGEQARRSDIDHIRALFPNCTHVINGFGLTESSVSLQHHRDLDTQELTDRVMLPIGSATPGMTINLVDPDGIPTSLYGEIELESTRIAAGYWDPQHAGFGGLGQRLKDSSVVRFRTGDLGRMLPDGSLVHQGRKDYQIQIHGCRVEIGEVVSILRQGAGVIDAAVLPVHVDQGEAVLHAFLVIDHAHPTSLSHLRAWMASRAPGYLVPARWSIVDEIPRVGGGKVHHSALVSMARGSREIEEESGDSPMNDTELFIAEIYSDVLGCTEVCAGSDFFELGGSSFQAIQVFAKLRDRFATTLPLASMFRFPTVQALAREIMNEEPRGERGCFIPMRVGRGDHKAYLLPGNGGHPLGFRQMLTQMGPEGSYIGVQLPGTEDPDELIENIKDLAGYLLPMMKSPRGVRAPDLVGYSYGGALAFEMALQFQELGRSPGRVILLDTHNLSGLPPKSSMGKLIEHARAVLGKGEVNGLSYLRKKAQGTTGAPTTQITRQTGNPVIDRMIRVNQRAVVKYSPGRVYRGEVVLVRAAQPSWLRFHQDDGMNGWGRWMDPRRMRVFDVDVRHMALLDGESATRVARIVEQTITGGACP